MLFSWDVDVAQSVEHSTHKAKVTGSIPVVDTIGINKLEILVSILYCHVLYYICANIQEHK